MSNLPIYTLIGDITKESKDKCCHCRYYSLSGKCRKKNNIKVYAKSKSCNIYKSRKEEYERYWPEINIRVPIRWSTTSRRATAADMIEAIRRERI